MTFNIRRSRQNGSALVQALMLISMIGLISVGIGEYSEYSNTTLNLHRGELVRSGVGDIFAGVFKSSAYCGPANIDFDYNMDGTFNDDIGNDVFITGTAVPNKLLIPMRIQIPFYGPAGVFYPLVNPISDTMMDDFGVAIGNLNLKFLGPVVGSPGQYRAEVQAGFLARRGLFGTQLNSVGYKRVASIVITRNGSTDQFLSCVTQSTAADFCEDQMGCKYLINATGNESCVCGIESTVVCNGPNQYLAGFLAGGAANCQTWPSSACPLGQYMLKVNPDGTPNCAAWPFRPCTAAPGTLSWSNAGSGSPTCTNNMAVMIPPGETWPVGDFQSAGGTPVGRAYFSCAYPSSGSPAPTPALQIHGPSTPQECL